MSNYIYTIYKITNNLNNKIYIGVHGTINPNDNYMGSGLHIKRAITKYGKENFKKEILFEFDNKKDVYLMESEIVNVEFVKRQDTYNISIGGKGGNKLPIGYKHTKESLLKMSKSQTGRIHLDETKKKMSIAHIRKTLTKEHIKNISLNHVGNLGKKFTNETKNKMSIAHMGKVLSSKTKELLRDINSNGIYLTPIGSYNSSIEVGKLLCVSHDTIVRWCKNSDNIIIKMNVSKSKYLQSLKESPLGKTFKEIGFNFETK